MLEHAEDWSQRLLDDCPDAGARLRPRLRRLGLIGPYDDEETVLTARFAFIAICAIAYLFRVAAGLTGLPTPYISDSWLLIA
jgi:hypothetical protein